MNTDQKYELLYAGPLFTRYSPNIWIDYRGRQDDYMQGRGLDYFENSCRATYVHRQYAIQNLSGFDGYEEHVRGITRRQDPIRLKRDGLVDSHILHQDTNRRSNAREF